MPNGNNMGRSPMKISRKFNKKYRLMKYEIVEKCEGKLPIRIAGNRSFNKLER